MNMARLKRYYDKCHKCQAPVENPQADNGKFKPLCAKCWEAAEEKRRGKK